jgi:hypothetical protein
MRRILEAKDSELPYYDLIKLVLRKRHIGLEYIKMHVKFVQKHYIRQPKRLYVWDFKCQYNNLEKSAMASTATLCFFGITSKTVI